jgi:hypothetical protein
MDGGLVCAGAYPAHIHQAERYSGSVKVPLTPAGQRATAGPDLRARWNGHGSLVRKSASSSVSSCVKRWNRISAAGGHRLTVSQDARLAVFRKSV